MKNIFDDMKHISALIKKRPVCLLLDFDGTISPIVKNPFDAILPEKIKKVLKNISSLPNIRVGIITGRCIQDIRKRVGLKNIIYSGDHGFEIKGQELSFKHPIPSGYRKCICQILKKIRAELFTVPGVVIQNKKYSFSIHYRMVDSVDLYAFKYKMKSILSPYIKNKDIELFHGKKVFEIKPPVTWHKGKAAELIINKMQSKKKLQKLLPIYIGDDVTDEDAFKTINNFEGISIIVEKKIKSNARYFLKNINEVLSFLILIEI